MPPTVKPPTNVSDSSCPEQFTLQQTNHSLQMKPASGKNVDKIRGYFIIDLAMWCTIPSNNHVSPQKATLPGFSDDDRLRPVELCHVDTNFR